MATSSHWDEESLRLQAFCVGKAGFFDFGAEEEPAS